ncbi:MAG: hypothetical protein LAO21_12360 [Acidobacteriia bacterium]|nr:hypothetical protein [Terriglobia bacterium]
MPKRRDEMHAALGFRSHSGWAALVVLTGSPRSPLVLDRRRIELVDPAIQGSAQPYHAAEKLDLKDAEKFINDCTRRTELMARQVLRDVIPPLQKKGLDISGCGILLSSGNPAKTLAATLASHALIHAAEGDFFRHALIHASEHFGLPITMVQERELWERAASDLELMVDKLQARIDEMGRTLGPPWTEDQKLATLAGWLALVAPTRG